MAERDDRSEVEVVWEAPPNPAEAPSVYDAAMAELKNSPGRWARLRVFATVSPAYNARKKLKKLFPDERWEIAAGRIVRGEDGAEQGFGLWVRYRTPEQMAAVKRKP